MRDGMGIFKGFSFILLPFVLLSILASSENIDILSNETLSNETLINETLINDTQSNETLINDTFSNETMINETMINETMINETLVTEIPSNVVYEINITSVNVLKWIDASDNEEKFEVWRSDNGGEYTQIGEVPRTSEQSAATGGIVTFDDANLVAGHTYTYYVIAINVEDSLIPSDIATVDSSVPLAPSGLTGTAVKSGPRYTVTLGWIDNANNENGFQIQRSIATSFQSPTTYSVGADVTTFADEKVPSYRRGYYYRVRAINALGNSGWSDVLHVNTT
jgi:hypothetical protein